jgi:hypothetical protein
MAPGAIPHPGRVPEQRLLSPESRLRWRRRCGTLSGKTSILSRVFTSEAFYRQIGDVRGYPGPPHHRVVRPGCTRATRWCGHLLALLHLCFGLRLVLGKIGTLGFVSSNSENIFYVTFLKHKNSRKQELAPWHLVNRLVPENA